MTKEKEEITCVRKHIEAIEKQGRENAAAARVIEKGTAEVVSGITAQERENTAAVNEMEKGARAVQAGIRELEKETGQFIDLFYQGHVKKE